GPKAIERVRRAQPAAYLKILALLCPREHKVEHSNLVKELTDEQLEAMIEYIKALLEAGRRSGQSDRGDDRTYNSTDYRSPGDRASQAQAERADDGGRHGSRPEGAHSAQDATASGRVTSTIWRVAFFEREDLPCVAMDPAPPSSVPPKILESV